ncbi:MAG: DUF3139 domain-containing protein [Ruminococcaceae bacterium]|nr:DUF3139 domain-containing protein [Oscillospiraceae bacterium]
MKKKILKVLALVVAIILIIGIGIFANGLVGNPVSKYLATKSANEYLEKTYSDKDFVIEEVNYDFKTGGYYARVTSPTSIDSHFSLSFDLMGKLVLDAYDDVTSGWNTAMRLEDDYRNAVKAITESKDFSEKYFIAYGEIPCILSDYPIDEEHPEYALQKEELVIDKIYDIKEVASQHGKLVLYAYDDEVTHERLAELLLDVKNKFDNSGVTFKAVDFVLEPPKVEGEPYMSDEQISIRNFYYSDIYEDGLVERVKKANQETIEYYEEQDKIKEQEISGQ